MSQHSDHAKTRRNMILEGATDERYRVQQGLPSFCALRTRQTRELSEFPHMILGWSRLFMIAISCLNLFTFFTFAFPIVLTALTFFVALFTARQTLPYVPWPSFLVSTS